MRDRQATSKWSFSDSNRRFPIDRFVEVPKVRPEGMRTSVKSNDKCIYFPGMLPNSFVSRNVITSNLVRHYVAPSIHELVLSRLANLALPTCFSDVVPYIVLSYCNVFPFR
jgi:hypothetical protein